MPKTKSTKELERIKKEDYYSKLMPQINFRDFLKKSVKDVLEETVKTAQPKINIPPVKGTMVEQAPEIAGPETPDIAPPATGIPEVGAVPGAEALPPLPETPAVTPPASGPKEEKLTEEEKTRMLRTIDDIKDQLKTVMDETKISIMKDQIIEEVKGYYKELDKEIQSIKDRKIPEREFYDTEGAYREHLYGMATQMLDEFLPELFEDIPEYSFTATQISRVYDDGTVADALITIMARIAQDGMKYDFKIDVPVLNGLMQYPPYIERGHKIIPLTKPEIQKELRTLSYRKEDVKIPYDDNTSMFTPRAENIYKKPDKQKWYNVKPNKYKSVGLPPDHKYQTQKGVNTR